MTWKRTCLAALLLLHLVSGCGGGAADNKAPHAVFSTSPDGGSAPVAIRCDASASFDVDGAVTYYFWDFGDGQIGAGSAVDHTYTTPGAYTVTLTVTDDKGATGSAARQLTVAANQAPTAAFDVTPGSGPAPLDVTFDAGASGDSDGSIGQYAWDFGDGQTGTGINPGYTYTAPGTYTVRLTVTDNGGATASITHDIVVTAPLPKVVTVSWTPNRETAVNSPGGGYRLYYGSAPDIDIASAERVDVPYLAGPTAPTSAILMLASGTYYFKVVAYSALNGDGSEPSQETAFTVP